jgi:hypothetical protein
MGADPLKILAQETTLAYHAFNVYLKMGPTRSISGLAKKIDKSEPTLDRWSAKFQWIERIKENDERIAIRERNNLELAAAKRGVNWAVRSQKLKEKEWDIANRLMDGGKILLERLLAKQERKLTGSDVARLLEVASKLGRLSAGMATEQTAIAVGTQNTHGGVDFSAALVKAYGGKEKGVEVVTRSTTGMSGEGSCVQVSPSEDACGEVIDVEVSGEDEKKSKNDEKTE